MGQLILPAGGLVYIDAQIAIYSVERHPVYAPLLRPLWEAVAAGAIEAVSSELALMETLIGPLRHGNADLARDYESFFRQRGVRLVPVSLPVLREAARLRASIPSLRTPDALHAATAAMWQCSLCVTNDKGFRQIPGLPLTILDDLLP